MPKTPSGSHPSTSPSIKVTPTGGKGPSIPPATSNIHGPKGKGTGGA